MRARTILLVIAVLSAFAACDDSPTQSTNAKPFELPNQVGNTWAYQQSIYGMSGSSHDTISVMIISRDTLNTGDSVTVRVTWQREDVDTSFIQVRRSGSVAQSPDTVTLYGDRDAHEIVARYLIPLRAGMTWFGNGPDDTIRVVGAESLETSMGTVQAFRLRRTQIVGMPGNGHGYSVDSWLADGIGIIRIDSTTYYGTELSSTQWELLDWSRDGAIPIDN